MILNLDNKNHGLSTLNPLMPPLNSMNDKSMLNMLPNFDDPVEQSLASLEQTLACKFSNQEIIDRNVEIVAINCYVAFRL